MVHTCLEHSSHLHPRLKNPNLDFMHRKQTLPFSTSSFNDPSSGKLSSSALVNTVIKNGFEYDLLDNRKGRLHTNFLISATLSKKVLIFSKKLFTSTSTFKFEVEVDTIWGENQKFFTESS